MTEFASEIVGRIVGSLMVPVKKHMDYLFLSTEHVRNMSDMMKQLEGTVDDVKKHKDTNDINTLEIPARVPGWLDEVAKIKSDAETISSNENRYFNIKARYQMGKNAWKTTQKIEGHLQEGLAFSWTDAQKPLGRVYTRRASTSTPSTGGIGDDFNSRDTTFKDALKFLEQDHKTQVIALCGMGGVGKTTMMEQLIKVVEDKKMFDWIVKVVIGKQPNWHSIQKAVAENLGNPLTEEIETTRADRLHKRFEETLKKSEKGILVILDDVWEKIELRDVGLCPLANGVKLLLTSRDEDSCKKIAVVGNLDLKVLKVNVLEDDEAHKFFCQITKISKESDPELYQIGGDIVKKCSHLPLAIKLIAPTLISEEKSIWKDSLRRLRNNDLDQNVHEIIKISYDYLKDQEDKEIFLLCGLFPENSNIAIEDLTRYAWGLKLLKKVSTVGDGRNKIKTCVRNLKNANLLIDGDSHGCVKMHDLVLAFVSDTISKGDHASIINHGDMSKWSSKDMSKSCKRISLTCRGMCEFPKGFKCPNLSLLKLMHGDDSFKFPRGFFKNTKKLKVIVFEKMQYSLLPRSLQCSTNLRMLCLHECSLMFDFSFIGDLLNLEVLSITKCNIRKLPSTFGNLKKLKVLDLTGCIDLLIDDGVLKRLVKLEELYMISSRGQTIRFTDNNVDELVGCSKKLTTLAIEFNDLPKNISFKKLERFKISLGCNFKKLNDQSSYTFENTLRLVTHKHVQLDSRMNQLFDKVEVLYLQVNGVNDLEDGLAGPLHHRPSFSYLRVLDIFRCADLRYLFTVRVANGLKKLERLTISYCSVLETVVDGDKGGVGVITFQALKFLSLKWLPKLKSLCNVVGVIVLPEVMELQLYGLPNITIIHPSFFNKELPQVNDVAWSLCQYATEMNIRHCEALPYVIPSCALGQMQKLEKLEIKNCKSLVEVFETQGFNINGCNKIDEGSGGNDATMVIDQRMKKINVPQLSNLKTLRIFRCDLLQHVLTFSTLESLKQLVTLSIRNCKAMKVIVKENNGEQTTMSSKVVVFPHLKSIRLEKLPNLTGFFLGKNEFHWPLLHDVMMDGCPQMMVFTPGLSIARKLKYIRTSLGKHSLECGLNFPLMPATLHESPFSSVDTTRSSPTTSQGRPWSFHNLIEMDVNDNHDVKKIIPSNELLQLQKLEKIQVRYCYLLDEVFEALEGENSSELQSVVVKIPKLREVELESLYKLKYIWKNKPWMALEFPNLTKLSIKDCGKLEHVFSSSMVGSLLQLQYLHIHDCRKIEVIVKEEEGECDPKLVNRIIVLPRLKSLTLKKLPSLKEFCLGKMAFSWPSLDTLKIKKCKVIRVFTMGHSTTPKLRVIDTSFGRCELVTEQDLNSFINTKLKEGLQFGGKIVPKLHLAMTPMTTTTSSTSMPVTSRIEYGID